MTLRSGAALALTFRRPGVLLMITALVIAAVISAAGARQARVAQPGDAPLIEDRLALLKAGAVRHLPGHTEWPARRFDDDPDRLAPIIITVVGEDGYGFERYLERVAAGQRAHDRAIVVRRLRYPRPQPGEDEPAADDLERFRSQLAESHVLYIGSTERAGFRYRRILEWVEGRNILTVSFINGFAERGGMLGLAVRENRLAMDANINLIRQADLKMSSSLLQLARIVTSPESNREESNRN